MLSHHSGLANRQLPVHFCHATAVMLDCPRSETRAQRALGAGLRPRRVPTEGLLIPAMLNDH